MTLVDTNLLVRYASPTDPMFTTVASALAVLTAEGRDPVLFDQNLYEFWVVATRPQSVNGLGLTTPDAAAASARIEQMFWLLPDPPGLRPTWEQLVLACDCKGKVAHDARLVAAMTAYKITDILTFNGPDFRRFPGVVVLDPAAVATPPTP